MDLKSRALATMTLQVDPPQVVGATPQGDRRIVAVTSGTIEGRINGRILSGGDWLRLRPDGVLELDVRLTIETADGALVYMTYTGMRHGSPEDMAALAAGEQVPPERIYFRVQPRFETASAEWAWLNRILCIGIGERLPAGPRYVLHEIL